MIWKRVYKRIRAVARWDSDDMEKGAQEDVVGLKAERDSLLAEVVKLKSEKGAIVAERNNLLAERHGLTRSLNNLQAGKGDFNIYHCCIQKSASQWVRQILADRKVVDTVNMMTYAPGKNYLDPVMRQELLARPFPANCIISPVYVTYEDFKAMPKPDNFKAFWVMRDPRDLIVSHYYSMRYSHPIIDGIDEGRKILSGLSLEDGLMYYMKNIKGIYEIIFTTLAGWMAAVGDKDVLLCRYEDLTGVNQLEAFQKIFNHCGIDMPSDVMQDILNRYSFEKLTGRKQGTENKNAHLRKGIAGDWRNYFGPEHKKAFKESAGEMLIALGYEKDLNW